MTHRSAGDAHALKHAFTKQRIPSRGKHEVSLGGSAKTNDLARPGRYASRQSHFPPEREPDQKTFMHSARALPAQPTEVKARLGRLGYHTLRELQRQAREGA